MTDYAYTTSTKQSAEVVKGTLDNAQYFTGVTFTVVSETVGYTITPSEALNSTQLEILDSMFSQWGCGFER